MLDRSRTIVEVRIGHRCFTKTSQNHPACRPGFPITHSGNVDRAAQDLRISKSRLQRHEPAVAQAPYSDSIGIDIAQGLQIVGARIDVLRFTASEVPRCPHAPVSAVAGTAPIIWSENYITLLSKILAHGVVHPVVAGMPSKVVLIGSRTMHPDNGRMLLRAIEMLTHHERCRHRLVVNAAWIMHGNRCS